MEDALRTWLLDNRPYTHLNTRLRHFIHFCRSLEPGLSHRKAKRLVHTCARTLFEGEVGKLWMRDRAYERVLRLYGANDQRTAQWHTKRGEMITASEVYKIFSTPEARKELLLRKLEPALPSEGSGAIPALLWGTRFEPVAKKIYEQRTNCKILDVSCVQHPIHSFLGASPDGLIVPMNGDEKRYGRLVEFKCPMSRVEKPEIPIAYVHQMQMQMECTGIDECEYVEFRFKQVNYSEWLRSTDQKGVFTVYEDGKVIYDKDIYEDTTQVIYWLLTSIKEDFVPKDTEWLPKHFEGLSQFWNEVLEHRKNGTLPDKKAIVSLDI